MATGVQLHGYRYSVYSRTARLALLAKRVAHEMLEVDPFVEPSPAYLKLHPFGRVPALAHGRLVLFETGAITRYVDRAFDGPSLQPDDAVALARMDQVISVIDAYAYWPMVRQLCSHGLFRPLVGEPGSKEEVEAGLRASRKILAFLNDVAAEGRILTGREITLADCHLATMIDCFVRVEEGKSALHSHSALMAWWDSVREREIIKETDPFADRISQA